MSNTYRINFKQLRQENLKDTFIAIEHYSGIEMETIIEEHADLFDITENLRMPGARLTGRQLRPVLAKNKILEKRIKDILTDNAPAENTGPIARLMLYVNDEPVEYQVKLIEQLLHGLSDK